MNYPTPEEGLSAIRKSYLAALQQGSGRQADQVVDQSLDQGLTANQLYMDVFQPTAYEIGRLWQRNLFTVAQEHLATAIIERQMGQLHAYFKPRAPRNRTLVLGSVTQELHRVGVRMVADFFEQDGWTVYYLGATTPASSFVGLTRDVHADMIGISVQMVYHLPHIAEVIQEMERCGLGGLPVIVGGMPFIQQPELYRSFNVRFSAPNAEQAVAQANDIYMEG